MAQKQTQPIEYSTYLVLVHSTGAPRDTVVRTQSGCKK